jgi:hypothetical protein
MTVSAAGITIGEPLRQFHGVMTGVPAYEGDTAIHRQPT